MKKILFIELFKHSGAPAGLLTELDQLLTRKMYIPFVIHTSGSILDNYLTRHKICHLSINNADKHYYTFTGFLSILTKSTRFVFNTHPHIIHVNHYEWTNLGTVLALIFRKKLYIHLKDVYPIKNKISAFIFSSVYKKKYIAVSKYVKKLFTTRYPLKKNDVIVIYDGISEVFSPAPTKNLNTNKVFQVGMISRIASDRGIREFIETAQIVCSRYPKTKFIHRGYILKNDADQLKKYKKIISRLNLEKNIHFLPYISSKNTLKNFYQSLDVFIITANQFAFPNVAVEALMCGIPVISGKVGGLTEIIKPQINGYLLNDLSPKSFATKLFQLISRPDILNTFKKNCPKTGDKFKASQIIIQLEKEYEGLT